MTTREFTLAGHVYAAPEVIGAGILAKINTRMSRTFAKQHPKQIHNEKAWLAWYEANSNSYDYIAAVLQSVLRRGPKSPPVLAAYDEATDGEVAAVLDFFGDSLAARYAAPNKSPETSSDTEAPESTPAPTKKRKMTRRSSD